MRVRSVAEDIDYIDRFRQVFARMSCFSSDLHVEGQVGCTPGNDCPGLECVIKYNAVAHVPGRWIERYRAKQPDLLLHGEHGHYRRGPPLSGPEAAQYILHNGASNPAPP